MVRMGWWGWESGYLCEGKEGENEEEEEGNGHDWRVREGVVM